MLDCKCCSKRKHGLLGNVSVTNFHTSFSTCKLIILQLNQFVVLPSS